MILSAYNEPEAPVMHITTSGLAFEDIISSFSELPDNIIDEISFIIYKSLLNPIELKQQSIYINVELLTFMCLAVPAKVLSINGDFALVDFGGGVKRDVNISMVNASVNDYVIVHVGYAIEVLDEKDALASLELWNELAEMQE